VAGFTLAELLIALAILGELATFTIPKVISAQQQGSYNAAAKEAIATVSQAYQLYQFNNTLSSGTKFGDMTSYINYVQYDTTRTIDSKQTNTSLSCNVGTGGCLILHNGGALRYSSVTFNGTASTNALELYFDPNGTYGGTTDGPDKSVDFFLYYNGRITTRGTTEPNTVANNNTYATPDPTLDPPWFSW
jgi:prepilin-type N-terminal cleavage/methylation domain-containing protein